MKLIQTVTGPVHPDSLGFCHSHEHIYISKGRSYEINPALCIDDHAKSLAELLEFRSVGGGALVDAQPVGCGRDAAELMRLSQVSGVTIVASTGFHRLQFYPEGHWIFSCSADESTRIFLAELQNGMYTGCDHAFSQERCKGRAGVIKAALDSGEMDDVHQRLFLAAAQAAKQTGAAIMVHIEKGSKPLELVDIFFEHGVAPDRLVFCHMDRAEPDLRIHKAICESGVYLEYDTICRPKYHSDAREIEIIAEMLEHGCEDKLLLGLDATRERLRQYGGFPGLAYLKREFARRLPLAGVPESAVRKFFYENPAKAFAFDLFEQSDH